MTTREVVRKIRAWQAGKPLPRFSTLEFRVNKKRDSIGVVFIRMAGETRPWSIMVGTLDSNPDFFFASEPRDRALVNEVVDGASVPLLNFVNNWLANLDPDSTPQFWFPDETHVDMLHNIEYAYSREKTEDDRRPLRSAFGRLAGWLFRENQIKGQQTVMVCNRLITDAWVIPIEETRQIHLGHSLAWLRSEKNMIQTIESANFAIEERVGITLNADIERRSLEKPVKALQDGNELQRAQASESIEKVLFRESERRWNLMLDAHTLLENDSRKENSGVKKLVESSRQRLLMNYARIEEGIRDEVSGTPAFVPHPETDRNPAAAATSYILMNKAEDLWQDTLVDDDPERLHDMVESGDAFGGVITKVSSISSRGQAAYWTIKTTHVGPLRLKNGDEIRLVGTFSKSGYVEELLIDDEGNIDVLLTINFGVKGTVGAPTPMSLPVNDPQWIGTAVSFVPKPFTGQDAKVKRIWEAKDSPGAWLTHSVPKRQDPEPTPDDVTQIDRL